MALEYTVRRAKPPAQVGRPYCKRYDENGGRSAEVA
eukprot:CAMPEP_0202047974 /NCGR_PEP_ID=MMETSP0963-20130614/2354_1 /ASSEMBLY_ACC=CAM_ASM_000494 /TAXON_ID=4773 /ORGANISM="Schizochytrium aggregatum, Strain ATCC28209" /LENGTH=35 /DNA_ID= /DNA_START= /DNA_END= /DNA_ORIENTATION=